jgi:hypothetical protein
MIYVYPDEIKEVKKNLIIFGGKLKDNFVKFLLKPDGIRYDKHGLFFSLCNPNVFLFLEKALVAIKKYKSGKYFPRALRKLIKASEWLEHKAVVAEIIVVGYYFDKFQANKKIEIIWERKLNEKGGSVDVSLVGLEKNINIEVTALHDVAEQRHYFNLRKEIQIALEKMSESYKNQEYAYLFSLPDNSVFSKSDIPRFIEFIKSVRNTIGVGKHMFKQDGKVMIAVEIVPLNKSKTEYASDIGIFSRWNEDSKRIQDKIAGKVARQLPKGDINFVCVPTLDIWTNNYEMEMAMLGSEKIVIDLKSGESKLLRDSDDVSKILSEKSYESFYGLIYFNWDYSRKKIIGNPTKKLEGEVKKVIELIN